LKPRKNKKTKSKPKLKKKRNKIKKKKKSIHSSLLSTSKHYIKKQNKQL
jgi:hypothetical protein